MLKFSREFPLIVTDVVDQRAYRWCGDERIEILHCVALSDGGHTATGLIDVQPIISGYHRPTTYMRALGTIEGLIAARVRTALR